MCSTTDDLGVYRLRKIAGTDDDSERLRSRRWYVTMVERTGRVCTAYAIAALTTGRDEKIIRHRYRIPMREYARLRALWVRPSLHDRLSAIHRRIAAASRRGRMDAWDKAVQVKDAIVSRILAREPWMHRHYHPGIKKHYRK